MPRAKPPLVGHAVSKKVLTCEHRGHNVRAFSPLGQVEESPSLRRVAYRRCVGREASVARWPPSLIWVALMFAYFHGLRNSGPGRRLLDAASAARCQMGARRPCLERRAPTPY